MIPVRIVKKPSDVPNHLKIDANNPKINLDGINTREWPYLPDYDSPEIQSWFLDNEPPEKKIAEQKIKCNLKSKDEKTENKTCLVETTEETNIVFTKISFFPMIPGAECRKDDGELHYYTISKKHKDSEK